jgi:hypothetical protein
MARDAILKLRLSDGLKAALKAHAQQHDQSVSDYVRQVVLNSLATPSPLSTYPQHVDYVPPLAEPEPVRPLPLTPPRRRKS